MDFSWGGTCKKYFWIMDFNSFLTCFLKHNQWQHTHGWMGVCNTCWKYLSWWCERFPNMKKSNYKEILNMKYLSKGIKPWFMVVYLMKLDAHSISNS